MQELPLVKVLNWVLHIQACRYSQNTGTRSIQEHPSLAVCGFTFAYSASRGPKPWKRGIREQPILAVCGDFVGNNTFNL